MNLTTQITKMLGIKYPIIQAEWQEVLRQN